jgi:hypothetical protein
LTFSDAVISGRNISRAISDSVQLAETLTRSLGLVRSSLEGMQLSEALTRAVLAQIRAITDVLQLAESIVSGKQTIRAVTDGLSLSDLVTRGTVGHPRSIAETITLADSTSRSAMPFTRTATDSLQLLDSTFSARGVLRGINDAIALSDVASRKRGFGRPVAETIVLNDTLSRGPLVLHVALFDSISFAEQIELVIHVQGWPFRPSRPLPGLRSGLEGTLRLSLPTNWRLPLKR